MDGGERRGDAVFVERRCGNSRMGANQHSPGELSVFEEVEPELLD